MRALLIRLCLLLSLLIASSESAQATGIYWSTGFPGAIGRANLDGTAVNQRFIVADAAGVAVDGTYIYWADLGASEIGRANLDGTGVN